MSKTVCGTIPAYCLLFVAGTAAANAGTITLTVSGADTGTITLTETGNGTLITAISGTFDGSTIGSLIAPGGLGSNDNLFFTPAPYLDGFGVSFTLTTPDTDTYSDVNLFWDVGTPAEYESYQANSPADVEPAIRNEPDTVTVASGVPEPGTICLTLAGLAGLLALRRRC